MSSRSGQRGPETEGFHLALAGLTIAIRRAGFEPARGGEERSHEGTYYLPRFEVLPVAPIAAAKEVAITQAASLLYGQVQTSKRVQGQGLRI